MGYKTVTKERAAAPKIGKAAEALRQEGKEGKETMRKVSLLIDDYLYEFYEKAGEQVHKTAEQTMERTLFLFAGEASFHAIDAREKRDRH